jgi:hypothetical protein
MTPAQLVMKFQEMQRKSAQLPLHVQNAAQVEAYTRVPPNTNVLVGSSNSGAHAMTSGQFAKTAAHNINVRMSKHGQMLLEEAARWPNA